MSVSGVCRDVRSFLRTLAGELPELFPQPRLRRPRRRARARRLPVCAAQRERAREIINARVEHWAGALGLDYNRVFIKDQRTLWGSCSVKKNLNFNLRLASVPPETLDYVVIHELCHLREMNHSKKFWAHVGAACPGYSMHRRWLRKNCAAVYSNSAPVPAQ